MKTFPVLDEAILQDGLGISILLGEGLMEINLCFLAGVPIDLDVLHHMIVVTDGAMTSGLSLPAKPILVLREPTSMMRGIPYWWLNLSGINIIFNYIFNTLILQNISHLSSFALRKFRLRCLSAVTDFALALAL